MGKVNNFDGRKDTIKAEEKIILPELSYLTLPKEPEPEGAVYKTLVSVEENGHASVTKQEAVEGTEVAIVAVPYPGYKFVGWYEDGELVFTENLNIFKVSRDRTLVAKTELLTEANKEIKISPNVSREGYVLPYEDLSDPTLNDKIFSGECERLNRGAILNEGNRALLAKVLEKAKRGEDITIAAIGGSLTSPHYDVEGECSYIQVLSNILSKQFGINVTRVNAGVGSTGSLVGIHRFETDVLSKKPDLLLLEFSVNDVSPHNENGVYRETYEAIIRRALKQDIAIITIIFGSVNAKKHKYPTFYFDVHTHAMFYYDLPVINFHTAFWRYIENDVVDYYVVDEKGKPTNRSFSDGTGHSSTAGHKIKAHVINYYIQDVLKKLENGKIYETEPHFPKEPLYKNTPFYENARFYASTRYLNYKIGNPIFNYKDRFIPAIVHGNSDRLGTGWICVGGKGAIIFEIKGIRSLSLCMMHKTDVSGVYSLTINGEVVRDHVNTGTLNNVLWPEYSRVFDTPQDVYVTIECHSGVVGFGPIGAGF